MSERDGRYLRDSDAFSWYMESDPLLRSTIVSVVVLDRQIDAARVSERVDRAARLAPGFRDKVVQAALRLANPRWVVDPDFDLAFHVRHIAVPAPGTLAQVLAYASQTGMEGFDRARPLWEVTIVDGLEHDRSALVLKLHHALTDGIGGIDMAKYLFDLEPEPHELGPLPDAPIPEDVSSLALAIDAVRHNLSRVACSTRALVRGSWSGLGRAMRKPSATMAESTRLVASIARTVRPVRSTLSPVMTRRHLGRHYDTFAVPLDELRTVARDADVTLNDAFLAAVSGGLLRYHERHGQAVAELRLTMPISIRLPDDPIGGNRITLMRFAVPTGLEDPVSRMRRIHELCLKARHEPSVAYTNAIAAVLNVLPRAFVGDMLKHIDFLASNVPGIDVPLYLAGCRVAEWYAFGPTIGAALNVTLVSYDGTCYIGVNVDTAAVPDERALLECLRDGFRETAHVA